eukprot:2256968-Ditylum_brightwellii.AAC.1
MTDVSLHLIQLLDVPAVVAIWMLRYMPYNVMDGFFDLTPTVGCAKDANSGCVVWDVYTLN